MIKINAQDGLIGDFLGCLPAIQALARRENVCVQYHPEVKELFEMSGLTEYNPVYNITKEYTINCTDAWNIAIPNKLHITQAYFPLLGLDVPAKPVRAELESDWSTSSIIPFSNVRYIISPFSRSLPDNQKLPQQEWQRLADMLDEKQIDVWVIGSKSDPTGYITGGNVREWYGQPLYVLPYHLRYSWGLISIVSGPSHLAFHLGVKNYLITNQSMNWGNNPDAVRVRDYIPDLKAETIKRILDDGH